MRNFIFGFLFFLVNFIFLPVLAYGQKADSLKRFSNKVLLEKAGSSRNKIYLTELSKRKVHPNEITKMYELLGRMALYEGKYAESKKWFEKHLKFSKTDDDKILAYVGLSQSNFMLQDTEEALDALNNVLGIIDQLPTGNEKFRRKFFTLSIYALCGDFDIYQVELNKLKNEIREYIDNENDKSKLLKSERLIGKIYLELGDVQTRLGKTDLAKKYLDSSKVMFRNQPKNRFDEVNIYLKYNEAKNYYYANNFKMSTKIFLDLIKDCEKYKMVEYEYMSKVYLSKNYYQLKDYRKSLYYAEAALQKKLPIPDYSEDFETEALRYAFISSGNLGIKDKNEKYESLFVKKTRNLRNHDREQFIHSFVNKLNAQQAEHNNKNLKIALFSLLGISILFGIFSFRYYKNKTKKKIEKFRQEFLQESHSEQLIKNQPKIKKEKCTELDEKTLKILDKLSEFEESGLFLEQNFSLSSLASFANTNSVTLSSVINTHKQNNFNDYINGLRIDYIIEKMKNDSKYLNYKISYLAEEAGFSSHSIFTKAFKKRTNITPSQFIELVS